MARPVYPALVLALLAGCGDARPHALAWELELPADARPRAAWIEVRLRGGGCGGDVFWTDGFAPAEGRGPTPPLLSSGDWCFEAEARDGACLVIASGSAPVALPLSDGAQIRVILDLVTSSTPVCTPPTCERGRCAEGVRSDADLPIIDAGPVPDGGGVDAFVPDTDGGVPGDGDGDGVPAFADCDDGDPTVYPGRAERCDGRDEDCDDLVDEGAGCPCVQVNRPDGGHSYISCSTSMARPTSRDSALATCAGMCAATGVTDSCGYHMVKIEDMAENDFVATRVLGSAAWLGLARPGGTGAYAWEDGALPLYTNYSTGPTGQPCVRILATTGEWEDVGCTANNAVICEAP